ncbi:copper resistance D family protein [Mycolicibacterium fluoranthenivorans]|uniref:Putative copper resistance protein D n=1 Tax=Mycolicibacterium fluoranthenivorans TaxID=258505 RepID=A0A7X5R4D4_9MYCO|nr:CopD family protein [Mycolicibacterium fluoranthenivorans]MCV7355532.1 CopD family protein [Mycolicibacterium fluoranthenivorans]NIH93085.1 putative copper resistance protein D [Mycolicibacterium fluoranthenivorans]
MLGGLAALVVGLLLAWALTYPQVAVGVTVTRAAADVAAVVVLGLALVPMLDVPRYRDELATRSAAALTVAAALWLVAEVARLCTAAAATAAVPLSTLGVRTTVEYAISTVAGRADLISVLAAALVGALTIWWRTPTVGVAVAGIAAIGTTSRTLAGHLSENAFGGIAVTLHALAAAVWCGLLAALVLTVGHRGQWARVLPRFSALSLWSVVVLLVGGIGSAVVTLDAPTQLWSTGYGRLVLAKVLFTAALLGLAWHNRTDWLPSARGHRVTAATSSRRSYTELALMTVALTLAAALAVTG